MIVLANRPGFPFLGNDFFGAMVTISLNSSDLLCTTLTIKNSQGDIFSCHAVDNPDMAAELKMLQVCSSFCRDSMGPQ